MQWTPKLCARLWRLFALLLFGISWIKNGSEVGLALLLFLSIMVLARWRFYLPSWAVIIDYFACFMMMKYCPYASMGLALPVFEATVKGTYWLILPVLALGALNVRTPIYLYMYFVQAIITGLFIQKWWLSIDKYKQEADQQRQEKYELESLKKELLVANVQTARMAELSERNRIAAELHDDVGHELTAAVLALQAFEQLWKEEDPAAKEMFYLAQKRIFNSASCLRETVHNMKPVKEIGIEELQDLCHRFMACPVSFNSYGDTSRVPIYLWGILQTCLKEALTNVLRHSKATRVEVSLDINPHIIRLSVGNDGVSDEAREFGIGLRNLRQRAKAVGGNISTDTSGGFQLICVLPLEGVTL